MRPDERDSSSQPPENIPDALSTEPSTGVQFMALRDLERIAAVQAAGASELRPPLEHDPSAGFFPVKLPEGYVNPASRGDTHARTAPKRATDRSGHGKRFTLFSLIGLLVLVLGIGVQYLLVNKVHAGAYGSYVGQAIFSIELSFLLNRTITWRDRKVGLGSSFVRFNVQKLAMTVPNFLLYALLHKVFGAPWLVANLATTAVFTIANYVTGDLWAFTTSKAVKVRDRVRQSRPFPAITVPLPALSNIAALPTVSVVIPCKGNEKTIRATVQALLQQDYPALLELILVGDVTDSTWSVLRDITDPRLVLLEQEKTPGRRDPNIKRAKGIRYASGQVLALADSDIVMDPDWLSQGIRLLYLQGSGLVAGGMRSVVDTFWGRFVDRNALAAKTPRIPQPYSVTAVNFGKKGFKPPITANAVFTRDLYNKCALDTEWAYGYEDYEWFWRVARNGHSILYSSDLTASHHHRSSFRRLLREYRQSSNGCARFALVHRDSPLAKKRVRQAIILPLVALTGLAGVGFAVASGYGLYVLAACLIGGLGLMIKEMIAAKSLEAALYPPLSILLGLTFTINLGLGLIKMPLADPSVRRPVRAAPLFPRPSWRWGVLVGTVLAAGLAARLWDISHAPEWQLDEITYDSIAVQLLRHGTLNVPLAFQQQWQPFLYHPPFYLFELLWWFRLVGPGISHARVLGAILVMVSFGLLAWLLARLHGASAAAFAILLMVFDGWLLYVDRISYIENSVVVIMLAGLVLFERAIRTGRVRDYILTGLVVGFAAVFNNDAGYLLVVLAIHWLLVRRDSKQHLAAIGAALAVVALWVVSMVKIYTINGTDWWWHDTFVQLRRVTGGQSSAGTVTNPAQFLVLLTKQYDLFLPSVAVVTAALVLVVWQVISCARKRNLTPLGEDRLLPAWVISAVVVFGPASLHFSQYFVMALLPMYSYLWVSVWPTLSRIRVRSVVAAFSAVVVALGVGSAFLRLRQDSNAFEDFQQYAAAKIPPNDLVVAGTAGDPLAYVINQPWCSPATTLSDFCFNHSSYVVTWQTYLQPPNPLHIVKLQLLLNKSHAVARFQQFSGTITVWKITRPAGWNGSVR